MSQNPQETVQKAWAIYTEVLPLLKVYVSQNLDGGDDVAITTEADRLVAILSADAIKEQTPASAFQISETRLAGMEPMIGLLSVVTALLLEPQFAASFTEFVAEYIEKNSRNPGIIT